MPFALATAIICSLLVLPLLAAIRVALERTTRLDSASERLLLTMVLVPLVPLVEVLGLSLLPIDRPLRAALPWVHIALLFACVGFLVLRHEDAAQLCRRACLRCRRVGRVLDPATRVMLLVASATLIFSFAHAAWNTGDEHDGAMYRMLMAVQPYQDGRVGRIEFQWQDYADAYPRTIELIYSWTMLCTRTTVGFHLVNWYFLLVFGLATFVAARRAELRISLSLICALLAATTPLPIYLTGILYNDLASCASVVAALAFALPSRRRAWGHADLVAFGTALALGASAKSTVAVAAALLGAIRLAWMLFPARRASRDGGRESVGVGRSIFVLGVAAALAAIPYVRSWVLYGSPIWPLRLSIGPVVLFDGPMVPEQLLITAHGPWHLRWATAIYKLFQTTSQDANGSFGLLFAIAVVPAAALSLFACAKRPTFSGVLLCSAFWYVALVPASTNLRYSILILAPGYILLLLLLARVRRRRFNRLVLPALTVFLAINAFDYGRTIVKEVAAQLRWGVSLIDPIRNRLWYMQFMYIEPGVAPETHTAVHARVHPGERMVYSVIALSGLLYDPWFTYAIEYRSIEHFVERNPAGPRRPPQLTDAQAWLASLHADKINAVLVYANSAEDTALTAQTSGYKLVYDQPNEPGPRRARLYRRTDLP